MAELQVSAIPSSTLRSYSLNIHGRMACDGDTVTIVGQECGDGSTQFVRYKLEGETGATLKLVLRCPSGGDPGRIVLDETLQILPAESVIWFKL